MTRISDQLNFGPSLDIAARSSASIIARSSASNNASTNARLTPENQDNLLLIDANGHAVFLHDQVPRTFTVPDWPCGHVRLAVLDGMGGHGHGREVAEATVAGLLCTPACSTLEQLSPRLDALHARLQQQFASHGRERRPGTTLTLLEIAPGAAPLLYHVGDSRLYEITAETSHALTVDHVPATSFAMHGLLGEREWWQQVHAEHRPQITQAFVLGNAFAHPQVLDDGLLALNAANLPPFLRPLADRRPLKIRPDATYLLATDGFWSCAQPLPWIARWPRLLAQPEHTASDALDALFQDYAAHPPPALHVDNISAIVLRFPSWPALDLVGAENIDETALPRA